MSRIGWLLQALSLTENTSLMLDVTTIGGLDVSLIFSLFPGAKDALSRLTLLRLVNKDDFSPMASLNGDELGGDELEPNSPLALAHGFLRSCNSLRNLHLHTNTLQIRDFLEVLPSSLRELKFSWLNMWWSPWNAVEEYVPTFLKSKRNAKKLRRLVICNYEVPFYKPASFQELDGSMSMDPCPATREACYTRGIELDLWTSPPE